MYLGAILVNQLGMKAQLSAATKTTLSVIAQAEICCNGQPVHACNIAFIVMPPPELVSTQPASALQIGLFNVHVQCVQVHNNVVFIDVSNHVQCL